MAGTAHKVARLAAHAARHLRLAMPFELPRRRALDNLVRPTRAEVSEAGLRNNVRAAKKAFAPADVLAVVKANAYGHGAVQVARVLETEGVAMLGVALVEEGIELRNAGVRAPILVMGGSYEGGYHLLVEHQLTPTVFRREHLEGLREAAGDEKVSVHLKLDSGMGRIGALPSELPALLAELKKSPQLVVEGFMSQLANADIAGDELTKVQLQRFRDGLARVRDAGFQPKWRHLSNTAGSLTVAESHDGAEINLVRPGLMLYGLVTAPWLDGRVQLQRVMQWKTGITHLKTVEAGTPVSYGSTWTAMKRTVLATLPVGYADGYSRCFTNRAVALVRGKRCPVVGRVTMDMCMLDVTDVPGVSLGDEVVLLGGQGRERVDAEELASLMDSIHYEVLCGVGARVPRLLVP